jgi:hypothetical protein
VEVAKVAEPALAEVQYAAAAKSLVVPGPAVIRASVPAAKAPVPTFAPAAARASLEPRRAAAMGRFVVQIGAYKTSVQAEKAWAQADRRYRFNREPLSTTVSIAGRGTFHRLSVSGFDNHYAAVRLCGSIKARGGACFVRTTAGDAPVQWASRLNKAA